MRPKSFPKPPPADPLPVDIWLDDTDRAEVGREAFFRGRDKEYAVFQNAVNMLKAGRIGGGAMIFQGAPGVGKSALMAECMEAVRLHSSPENPWVAVDIKPGNLKSPIEVMMLLVDAISAESERLSKKTSGNEKLANLLDLGLKIYLELSERGMSIGGFSVGGKPKDDSSSSVLSQRVFQNASELLKNFHMVVFVDEAQNTPVESATSDVIDCLNNPPVRIPLITAFFGLGNTKSVLNQCGLSRFARGRVVTLDTISHEDATSAIQGVFNAYGFKGTAQAQTAWVNQLADLSQGWPQHINSVSVAASRVICDHGGVADEVWLPQALERGQELKEEYYDFRLDACSQDLEIYEQLAFATNEMPNGILSRSHLRNMIASMLEESGTTFDDFLINALHAGVLMETGKPPKHYRIPIPSLGDYLRRVSETAYAG